MSKGRVASAWALLFVFFFASTAQAFFDPPWITPANPVTDEMVSVNVYGGICDWIAGRDGYPQITQEGNAVRILEYGAHYEEGDELCIDGTGTVTRQIGAFPAGDYTLTVDLVYQDQFTGRPEILNIGVVPFTVTAPPEPVSVPTGSSLGMGLLLVALLATAILALKRRSSATIVLLLVGLPFGLRAQEQTIEVLLSNAPGAPTPAQVVAWAHGSPRSPTPPLQAFNTKVPLRVDPLMADRATGDFLAWLKANPNSARKKLEDILLTAFPAADIPAALAALQADPYVANAAVAPNYQLHSVELTDFEIVPGGTLGGNDQYGWFDMNLDAAWRLAGGYALVGQVDMGLYVEGAAFRQFSGGTYVGGNFVPAASKDVGLTGLPAQSGFDSTDVDEKKVMYISDTACTPTPGLRPPAILGHGTHTAGLLAANGAAGLNVQGTCKRCGISAFKAAYLECVVSTGQIIPRLNTNASNRAKAETVDIGVQVLSMSLGAPNSSSNFRNCRSATYQQEAACLAVDYAVSRDVAQVASSGNLRTELDFPASDKRVISAGGFQPNAAFWDESPDSSTNCPLSPDALGCGSNYSKLVDSQGYKSHQELLGSAKRVLSTTYPNTTWVDYAECGDGYGPPSSEGIGWCTGTSMSAPQVAGVLGLLRSAAPLSPVGVPEPASGEKPGLRTVLAQTASRSGAWDPKLGYGIPDAAAAARKVLGTAAGGTVRNRATPLFRLWQATTKDFAETTSPQYALSLMINQDKNYMQPIWREPTPENPNPIQDLGAQKPVLGYAFPYDTDDPTSAIDPFDTTLPATPRAAIYVLTTEYRPRSEWPELRPLHLMDKDASGGKDYLLATTTAEIETAHGVGYNLRTIQGYIYQPCTPEKTCIPPGAEKLWRAYNTTNSDCAVFLNSEIGSFDAAGYRTTAPCPGTSATMIGYAYPATDSDGDGLPDGFEYVVGTNPNAADSDGDGIADATEFPLAGIATGDPCMDGPLGARNCGADRIFKNGFEGQ